MSELKISPETKQAMLEFFMKTSLPRILAKRKLEQQTKKS